MQLQSEFFVLRYNRIEHLQVFNVYEIRCLFSLRERRFMVSLTRHQTISPKERSLDETLDNYRTIITKYTRRCRKRSLFHKLKWHGRIIVPREKLAVKRQ